MGRHGFTRGKMCDEWKFCVTGETSHGCGGGEQDCSLPPHTSTYYSTATTTTAAAAAAATLMMMMMMMMVVTLST